MYDYDIIDSGGAVLPVSTVVIRIKSTLIKIAYLLSHLYRELMVSLDLKGSKERRECLASKDHLDHPENLVHL